MLRYLPALAVASLLGGCFSPDYGEVPFWCTADEPYCPEGFTCDLESPPPYPGDPNRRLCIQPGGGGGNGGGGECSDSDLESPTPNDTAQTATDLDASLAGRPTGVSLYGVEICTAEDVDYYGFTLSEQRVVTILVQYAKDQGELSAELLDSALASVAQGAPVGDGLQIEANASPDRYYLRVSAGPGGSTNHYDFSISLTPP